MTSVGIKSSDSMSEMKNNILYNFILNEIFIFIKENETFLLKINKSMMIFSII